MPKRGTRLLGFVIDKLTNSIENAPTAEVFDTEIVRLTEKDLKLILTKDVSRQQSGGQTYFKIFQIINHGTYKRTKKTWT